jgi:endonuclease YncB( thermonuclease family)
LTSLSASAALAEDFVGRANVIDGDTIEVSGEHLRLAGIDAPETGQRCVGAGRKIIRPGDTAKERLATMVSKGVRCTSADRDQYGRPVAHCVASDGTDINRSMVAEGLAWAFTKYSDEYLPEQDKASAAHVGVWALACDTPWGFRSKRWDVAVQKAPEGCPIKGNISGNGRIYHLPWDRFYIRTKIDTDKGERWFCDEGQAVAAGWRRAKQ